MKTLLVKKSTLAEITRKIVVRSVQTIPEDVQNEIYKNIQTETGALSKRSMESFLEKGAYASKNKGLICSDTGWPLFYVRCGDNVKIEGGFSTLKEIFKTVIRQETENANLRPTMVHPVSRKNPGTNVGLYYPKLELSFDSKIDFFEMVFVPKGGGSEIFGSFFKMLVAADGLKGVKQFIFDSFLASNFSGATCSPNIIGVGIGGSGDQCMKIAKEAAILRPIGDRNPDPEIAALEIELLNKLKKVGYGAMGFPGTTGALDVHVECALVHTGGLPVAYNAQCIIGRRSGVKVTPTGKIVYNDMAGWIYR